MVKAGIKKFGKIDILVNGAMSDAIPAEFEKLEWEDFQRDIDVAVKGAYNCIKATLPGMVENKYGKVVNITTIYANGTPPTGFERCCCIPPHLCYGARRPSPSRSPCTCR